MKLYLAIINIVLIISGTWLIANGNHFGLIPLWIGAGMIGWAWAE